MGRYAPEYSSIIGPDGHQLSFDRLPPPNTTRWVPRRKAEVVAAVRGGIISLEDACSRYRLTVEEFLTWQHALDQYGVSGLRSTQAREVKTTKRRPASFDAYGEHRAY